MCSPLEYLAAMLAEQEVIIDKMLKRLETMRQNDGMRGRHLEKAEDKLKKLQNLKNDFPDMLPARLPKIENEANFWRGQCERAIQRHYARSEGTS